MPNIVVHSTQTLEPRLEQLNCAEQSRPSLTQRFTDAHFKSGPDTGAPLRGLPLTLQCVPQRCHTMRGAVEEGKQQGEQKDQKTLQRKEKTEPLCTWDQVCRRRSYEGNTRTAFAELRHSGHKGPRTASRPGTQGTNHTVLLRICVPGGAAHARATAPPHICLGPRHGHEVNIPEISQRLHTNAHMPQAS